MGKKKKKNRDTFDIEREEQQELLDMLNKALDEQNLEAFIEPSEGYSDTYLSSMLDNLVSQRLEEESSEGIDDYCGDITESINRLNMLMSEYADDDDNDFYMSDDEDDEDDDEDGYDPSEDYDYEEESSDRALKAEISITHKIVMGARIVTISDGIKSIDIDLATLPRDDFELRTEDVDMEEYLATAVYGRLNEILTNFYPSVIMTSEEATDVFKNIAEYDIEKFHVFDYLEIDGPYHLRFNRKAGQEKTEDDADAKS